MAVIDDSWWGEALAGGEITQEQYDAHLAELIRGARVYVEAPGIRWCARHWAIIPHGYEHMSYACEGVRTSDDQGRCVPVPLYVEAPDP